MSSTEQLNLADHIDYYIPEPPFVPGTTFADKNENAAIFESLKIKNLVLPNRIGTSPMCMYSSNDKFEATPFHLVHYGSIASRGPALTFVEATSVSPEGGLSPRDLAIFNVDQAIKLKEIVDYVHAQRNLIGIQLAHGGRKASGQPLYIHLEQIADESIGGWPDKVVAPSAIQFRPFGNYRTPIELSIKEIERIVNDFGEAAYRAVKIAGFDVIEIHGAHGYLINEFLSPISNKRTDKYGGSFDNRIRFLLEIIESIKAKVGNDIPLFLRISAVENTPDPDAWTIEDSIRLTEIVAEKGIDVIDVSSGGNDYKQHARSGKSHEFPVHVPHARAIKEKLGDKILVSTVGGLDKSIQATNDYIEKGYFDFALFGKSFLKNPGLVSQFADELGVSVHQIPQYEWPYHPKRDGIVELIERTQQSLANL